MPPSLPAPGLVHTECHELLHAPVITNVFLRTRFLLIIPRPFSVVYFLPERPFQNRAIYNFLLSKEELKMKNTFSFPSFSITSMLKSKGFGLAIRGALLSGSRQVNHLSITALPVLPL